MGVLYGIDVGDGRGVRGTATSYDDYTWYAPENPTGRDTPQPTLDRLDAFASIVNTYSPFNVRELCDQQQTVGAIYGQYGPHSADVFDVGMLYVAELIGAWAEGEITFLLTDIVDVTVTVNVSLTVDPPITRDERLIPTNLAGFEVPEYLALGGKPLAVTGFLVDANAQTGIGSISEIQTFPEPRNVNVLARARWLPLNWTVDPFVTYWAPYSGVDPGPCRGLTVRELKDDLVDGCRESVQYMVKDFLPGGSFHIRPVTDISFDSRPGVCPEFRPRYSYYRNGSYVRNGSITMRKGRHMWCDEVNWNAEEVTFIMVAVLHEPTAEWCGLIETEAPNLQGLDPFFGIRYHRTGVLNLWADAVLASTPLVSGVVRPSQPVIVGLNIDMVGNTVSMLSADDTIKVQTSSLPHRYDNRSRMWLGRSPFGEDAASQIDILEVGYWETRFGPGDLYSLISTYDRIYGVTTS